MSSRQNHSSSPSTSQSTVKTSDDGAGKKKPKPPPAKLRPSSSILVLSHTNQVLLLRRVQTSRSFASAHVFPGGNLSSFHENETPAPEDPALHEDSEVYRLAAVRETFEESGILLAKKAGEGNSGQLLDLPNEVREVGRKLVHENKVRFVDWLRGVGGVPDLDGLMPFTRWITPATNPRRFSTQMYVYMLPLSPAASSKPAGSLKQETTTTIIPTPTHDGGLEHTAATFDEPSAWLAKARAGEIILFPPQVFLLHLVSGLMQGAPPSDSAALHAHYQAQRDALVKFLKKTPTTESGGGTGAKKLHPTALIPWADKAVSPMVLFKRRSDSRLVLGLDKPGPELKGTTRGGDWDRVVLVRFLEGPREVEVRWRDEVMREEREAAKREEQDNKEAKL
ncbi:hypothetical protein B0T17DRAFT_507941 [Bombardia bombarda]|uniref:Nudix hydrolase domain-containing protein n=1 Tax=Bombardia bombarda TaxID=252184 RepID=A0AA40C4N8_9PEZI|nr:hypothetical protein B0T17DRAFT_507941 [Bombardia bombarda]